MGVYRPTIVARITAYAIVASNRVEAGASRPAAAPMGLGTEVRVLSTVHDRPRLEPPCRRPMSGARHRGFGHHDGWVTSGDPLLEMLV